MKILRLPALAMAAALLAGLAGCSQYEMYGTVDAGVVGSHVSTHQ
ncbi:MAG TPA: hypothetical protein VF445_07435 [Bordetella sp.]